MNRWLNSLAPFVVIGSLSLAGCGDTKDPNAASTTTGGSGTANATGTTTSGTTGETPKVDENKPKDNAPLAEAPKDGDDVAVLDTAMGKIVVMFYPEKAPRHVENFINLAKSGFYNGTRFHRCMPGFMIQGGDPKSKDLSKAAEWGTGGNMGKDGKEVTVPAEFNDIHHAKGILSMARSQNPDSASSQFFIMVADNPSLDNQYSAFGKVVSGQDVAEKIVATGADAGASGQVKPAEKAVVLKSVTVTKWPVK